MQAWFKWVCGDECGDGHGKYLVKFFCIEADDTDEAIKYLQERFEKDCKEKLGVPIEDFFREYEEYKLKKADAERLLELGIIDESCFKEDEETEDDDEEYNHESGYLNCFFSAHDFLDIWVKLVGKLRPDIKLVDWDDSKLPRVETTGGYGLFE